MGVFLILTKPKIENGVFDSDLQISNRYVFVVPICEDLNEIHDEKFTKHLIPQFEELVSALDEVLRYFQEHGVFPAVDWDVVRTSVGSLPPVAHRKYPPEVTYHGEQISMASVGAALKDLNETKLSMHYLIGYCICQRTLLSAFVKTTGDKWTRWLAFNRVRFFAIFLGIMAIL
jgi:hypothetical protein